MYSLNCSLNTCGLSKYICGLRKEQKAVLVKIVVSLAQNMLCFPRPQEIENALNFHCFCERVKSLVKYCDE